MIVVGLILFSIPAWPLLAFVWYALRNWRGGWRAVAVLPALPLAYVAVRIVVDTSIDPTSHNLWPFEIVIWSIAGLIGFGLIALLRWIWSPRKPQQEGQDA